MQQFGDLKASELYCPKCRVARPVRERLLLVLPHSELHDYRCAACGTSVGSREVIAPPVQPASVVNAARRRAAARLRPPVPGQ
jgi:DNA-directed RNA polymerase subunit RPC12/RpoP